MHLHSSAVPAVRVRVRKDESPHPRGDYVLYWMTSARRARSNFGLQRAAEWASELGKPLVVLEALRVGYPWASDRIHRFILQGMADNATRFEQSPALYHPYVEPEPGAGSGLLKELSRRACVVVTDEFPCFFLPQMVTAAAAQVSVLFEQVDSNGLFPLRATSRVFPTAHAFRRWIQQHAAEHLAAAPLKDPLARRQLPALKTLPRGILARWPRTTAALGDLPIDHAVGPALLRGGSVAARARCKLFLTKLLGRYALERSDPDADVSSGLSPYLHFGHISTHEVLGALATREQWSPADLHQGARGSRSGFWGMSPAAEAFLDELITWREVGYNFCAHRDDADRFDSLPAWALRTLEAHLRDPRPALYLPDALEHARTHDPLWNAAQRQLVREGRMHNYLRMLWGKKILEWSASPRKALATMIHLNNKYALDGRNPNSYSGILWVLGRYDRPWGPERPIFGTVRYMSSANTARKLHVEQYLARYAEL